MGSVGSAAGVAALALWGADQTSLEIGARLAAVGVVALVAALVLGWNRLVLASLLLLGAAYAIRLRLDDDGLDAEAPLVGALLLLTAELGYWSLEERERVSSEPGEGFRRLAFVTGLSLAGLAVASGLLAVADVARTGGVAIDLLGASAAAAALVVVVLLARRAAR